MAEASEDFPVHRFVQELFEDLTLTLPSLGCRFEGTSTANALSVRGRAHWLKNKLFLFFADLAVLSPTLQVRFRPSVEGDHLILGFYCAPFDGAQAQGVATWDPEFQALFSSPEGEGFRIRMPQGSPQELGPPVHWHELAQRYGGAAHGRQVLNHFLERSEVLLPDLRRAIDSADASEVLRAAHTLKGSARGVTAEALAEAALQLEMLGRSGQLGGADDLYKALLETYDDVIRWVREGQS